ncbi:hypothetical protein CV093_12365 [Oceanobacillus sp. 143]|nr:hypothetical protein CV093_12365 [Oceanobacillus sp. 143]
MIVYGIITLLIIVVYFVFSIKAGKRYDIVIANFKDQYPLMFMAPVSLYIIDNLKIMERFYSQIAKIQQKMISLYGNRTALQHTRMYVAQLLSTVMVCLLGSFIFTLVSNGDQTIFFVGIIFTVLIPYAMISRLASQERERKQKILTELPEVVNKIILLVNAGETVQQALIRCVTSTKDPNSPLIRELTETVNKMVSNEPFHQVLNDLSKNVVFRKSLFLLLQFY